MRQTGKFDSGAGGSTNSWVVLVGNLVLGTAILLGLWAVFFFFGVSIWTVPSYCFVVYFGLIIALVEIKKITGVLKKYFLFVANGPIFGAFITALYFLIAVFIAVGVAKIIFQVDSEYLKILLLWGIAVSALIFIALAIINHQIIKSKITVLYLENNQIALVYYTDPGGKIIFYEKPLWGKFPFSIIKLPDGWMVGMGKHTSKDFKGEIHFCLKDKTISNRPVRIPITIKFYFSGPFKAQDFSNFLPNQLPPEEICLENEIKKTFLTSISPESRNNLHADVTDFFLRRIPQRVLLNDVLASVDFPKLFSNAKKTMISLEDPKFIFEKKI